MIKNGYYPIISSVYLDPKISKNAKQNGIKIINVVMCSFNIFSFNYNLFIQ